jgi:excinuclease ABC subunit C
MSALAPLFTDDERAPTLLELRAAVRQGAPKKPGVYVFTTQGRVIYVGKAKDLRARLASYFIAPWPESKSAQLIRCATGIEWRPLPSEFAALLEEQRLIRSMRPPYNVRGADERRSALVFLKFTPGPAPKIAMTDATKDPRALYFGPFRGKAHTGEAVRALSDLLGLRDCAQALPMSFADQATLFDTPRQARCMRFDLGTCLGPCAARSSAERYQAAVTRAAEFLEGKAAHPLDRVLEEMARAAHHAEFERAQYWKAKFELLERLFASVARLRAAVDGLSFVYQVQDRTGGKDDRVYLVKHGVIQAEAPAPRTPIERTAFAAEVERHALDPAPAPAARGAGEMDQLLLVMSWFRQHPEEYRNTSAFTKWVGAA